MRQKDKLKVLFVIRASGHFSYVDTIIEALIQKGHLVKAVFDKDWSKGVRMGAIESFSKKNKNFTWGWSPRRSDYLRPLLMNAREFRSYRKYLVVGNQSDYYLNRAREYLPSGTRFIAGIGLLKKILASNLIGNLFKNFEEKTPPDKKIVNFLKEFSPDIVILTPANMRFSEEIEFLKAAKYLNIPTVLPVLTWDNLTTKGLIYLKPDLVLAWNEIQKREAIIHHQIPQKRIKITGSPFFDKWFSGLRPSLNKNQFFSKLKLNPNHPYLLYLGSSNNIAGDEKWVVENIRKLLDQAKLEDCQIVIRPHPANKHKFSSYKLKKTVIYPQDGVLPSLREELQDYYNTLYYSFATVGINTSAMIDSIIVDKPVIAIVDKRFDKTQSEAQHFQQLVEYKVIEFASLDKSFIRIISQLLLGKDRKITKRKSFVNTFIRPKGLSKTAGQVAVEEIENLAYKI